MEFESFIEIDNDEEIDIDNYFIVVDIDGKKYAIIEE